MATWVVLILNVNLMRNLLTSTYRYSDGDLGSSRLGDPCCTPVVYTPHLQVHEGRHVAVVNVIVLLERRTSQCFMNSKKVNVSFIVETIINKYSDD